MARPTNNPLHHVVIVGGGFGGLYTAKALKRVPVKVTLIDRRNFHLFQPLLYQVATGGLSPGDVASPLRAILSKHRNTQVLKGEVVDVDPVQAKVILQDGELNYDTLIVATGSSHHYFGHGEWSEVAPGLKTVEDALEIRRRILLAFEAAERETDLERRQAWMTFVIVGGGPTGVELAGAIAELAHSTLKDDFRNIDPTQSQILLLEGTSRILPSYPHELSAKAEASLTRLGVTVRTECLVTDIESNEVTLSTGDHVKRVQAHTVLWAAGMKASGMAQVLADRTSVELDRAGRVMVEPDLSIEDHPNIFVIGDLAHFDYQGGVPLPGVAPVAMQQGRYVADLIQARVAHNSSSLRQSMVPRNGESVPAFHYRDKGSLAVIGRNAAVAELGHLKFAGFPAWLVWVFVHIGYLIEFDNKLMVLIQWMWNYFTRKRGARLITGDDPFPLASSTARDRLPVMATMPFWTDTGSKR